MFGLIQGNSTVQDHNPMPEQNPLAGDIATVYHRISGQRRTRAGMLESANRNCLLIGLVSWIVLYALYGLLV